MKKLLIICLLVLYGISAPGISLHLSFCCGKLEAVSLVPPASGNCAKGEEGFHDSAFCCDARSISFQIRGEQEPAAKWMPLQLFSHTAAIRPEVLTGLPASMSRTGFPATGPPDGISGIPIYLRNRTLRI